MQRKKLNPATENISITLPGWLITIMDKVAGNKDFNRSCFCKMAIKDYILHQLNHPESWEIIYRELIEK